MAVLDRDRGPALKHGVITPEALRFTRSEVCVVHFFDHVQHDERNDDADLMFSHVFSRVFEEFSEPLECI